MPTYEITVETTFSAAHALKLPDHMFEPIHGHDWRVAVTVAATQLDEIECVMDFHELEAMVEAIIKPWRNEHLNSREPFRGATIAIPKVNPTAERVAWHIGEEVAKQLDPRVSLVRVRIGESPGCTAEYRPDA